MRHEDKQTLSNRYSLLLNFKHVVMSSSYIHLLSVCLSFWFSCTSLPLSLLTLFSFSVLLLTSLPLLPLCHILSLYQHYLISHLLHPLPVTLSHSSFTSSFKASNLIHSSHLPLTPPYPIPISTTVPHSTPLSSPAYRSIAFLPFCLF